MKNKKEFFSQIELLLKLVAAAIFFIYAFGFTTWNIYLSVYNYFEYSIVQARYLSAGILFLFCYGVFIFYVFIIYKVILKLILWGWKKKYKTANYFFCALSLVLLLPYLFYFAKNQFPYIDQYSGGAKPLGVSIVGAPEQIKFLENFGLDSTFNGEGKASVQTIPICLLYQNNDTVILGLVDFQARLVKRILIIPRNEILGFNSLQNSSQLQKDVNKVCKYFYNTWK